MPRLPQSGQDAGTWGDLLNTFLRVEHNEDGTLKASGSLLSKYTKPPTGIPEADLSSGVQAKLNAAGSGGVADDSITNAMLQTNAVSTAKLQDGAVTTVKLESSLQTKLGTLSGTNTGDQDLSGLVPKTTTINSKALSGNISLSKTDVGLGNVDNTSDTNKPVSTATQNALNTKADSIHAHTIAQVTDLQTNLDNKASTTDLATGLATKADASTVSAKYTKPSTGIPAADLADDAVTTTKVADTAITEAKLATAIQTKLNQAPADLTPYFNKSSDTTDVITEGTTKKFLSSAEKTKLSNLSGTNTGDQDLSGLVSKTTTVNGQALSGNITLTKSNVGLANVDNTSDAAKPISTATQTALDAKASSASLSTVATSGSYNDILNKPSFSSLLTPTASITSPYTAVANDLVLVDASAGSITVTLPVASANMQLAVKKIDSSVNTVIIQRAGSDTIGAAGSSTITLRMQDETRTLLGRAGSWVVSSSSYSLASLDARFGLITTTHLTAWTNSEAYSMTSVTRDTNDAITTATVVWPDGSTGTFTTDTKSSSFPGGIDAFHVTYVPASGTTKTITQSAITRNANGAVTARPALVIT